MRTRSLLALCVTPAVIATCARYPTPDITITEGSRTPAPVFHIDGPEAPRIITFERRRDATAGGSSDTTWHLLRRNDTTITAPLRLTYGIVPDGYRAVQPADSLDAATYRIHAKLSHAGSALFFTVAADGTVNVGRAAQ